MGERETFPKRPREEGEGEETTVEAKRHHHQQSQQQRPPSYHHFLSSLLEEEGAGGGDDEEGEISTLMSALQQELSSSDGLSLPPAALGYGEQAEAGAEGEEEEGCDAEGLMRRLLEASDDDLGIPPSGDAEVEGPPAAAEEEAVGYGVGEEEKGGGVLGGGLWVENLDMDAIAASYCSYDYYALLQPGLFL